MSSRNIVQIKLQKRLLEEKLNVADSKIDRLSEIMVKKNLAKSSSLGKWDTLPTIEDNKLTATGLTLGELRVPTNKIKALSTKQGVAIEMVEANANINSDILRIRQTNAINRNAKPLVRNAFKKKEQDEILRLHNQKKIPKVTVPESMLPNRYVRGELPCTIEHGAVMYLSWACPLENLDYEYYLPIFFDGLQVKEPVVKFIARQGIEDMLYASKGAPQRVIPVVPLLAKPLRNALAKFDIEILLAALKAIEQLITCNEGIGEVLMPFGKQFLAPISFFMAEKKNIGDRIDYGQRKGDDIGEEIRKVLELMEENGGPTALRAIQFSIPLYQSCVKRPDAHHHRSDTMLS